MSYQTIKCETKSGVARVNFCRPEVHNAFNDTVIYEMTDLFRKLGDDKNLRAVVLTGEGK